MEKRDLKVPCHLAALEILLQHPALAADPVLLCSAALVCTSWQKTVAASGASSTQVLLTYRQPVCREEYDRFWTRLSSFTAWLAKHMHLVHSLEVLGFEKSMPAPRDMTCQALGHALQLGAVHGPNQQLQQFKADTATPALLASLPTSLTNLSIDLNYDAITKSAVGALSRELPQLKHLQDLRLDTGYSEYSKGPFLKFAALKELCCLTKLDLTACASEDTWMEFQQTLPQLSSLAELLLCIIPPMDPEQAFPVLDLQPLTNLTSLLFVGGSTGRVVQLPKQLPKLTIKFIQLLIRRSNPVKELKLLEVEGLRWLQLCFGGPGFTWMNPDPEEVCPMLADAQRLTQLTHLGLMYDDATAAAHDVACWPTMPKLAHLSWNHLQEPRLSMRIADRSAREQQKILMGLHGLTGLTCLAFEVVSGGTPAAVCASLTRLTDLRELRMQRAYGQLQARDAQHLSSLRQLTCLVCQHFGPAVDDTVAVSLGLCLTNLQKLDLSDCALQTDAAVPVLARLSQPTALLLMFNTGITSEVLDKARAMYPRLDFGPPPVVDD